jgi:hypothetical protein
VNGVGGERGRLGAGAGSRKDVRGRKKETKTSSKGEFTRGKSKRGGVGDAGEPEARGRVGGTSEGTEGSRREGSRVGREKSRFNSASKGALKARWRRG